VDDRCASTRTSRRLKAANDDNERLAYLRTAQKLRGYVSKGGYEGVYIALDETIRRWFRAHAADLGSFATCLRANYTLAYVPVAHEELMRGVAAGQRAPGRDGRHRRRAAGPASGPDEPVRVPAHAPPLADSIDQAKRKAVAAPR